MTGVKVEEGHMQAVVFLQSGILEEKYSGLSYVEF